MDVLLSGISYSDTYPQNLVLGDRFFSFVPRKKGAEWVGASKFNKIPSAIGRLLLCQPGTAHPATVHVAA